MTSYGILRLNGAYQLVQLLPVEVDGTECTTPSKFIGSFKTRYEAEFEKFQLEHRGADPDATNKALWERYKRLSAPPYKRRRSRFDRIRRNEDVL